MARATAAAAALVLTLFAQPTSATPTDSAPADLGAEVVLRALSLLGVKYRFGGNTPETGLDCSGLVRLVFQDTIGAVLPRRSEEISRVGGSIGTSELQPGDLVFFNTLRRAFSHVGIYIGNNQFVHAPSTGGSIRVERLDGSYWAGRFDGARRLVTPEATLLAAAPAQAASSLQGASTTAPLIATLLAQPTRTETAATAAGSSSKARPASASRRTAAPAVRTGARPAPAVAERSARLLSISDVYTH